MAPKDAICPPVIAAADISFSSTYSIFASNLLPGLLKLRLHLLLLCCFANERIAVPRDVAIKCRGKDCSSMGYKLTSREEG